VHYQARESLGGVINHDFQKAIVSTKIDYNGMPIFVQVRLASRQTTTEPDGSR
jgi:hypothetical protein